MSSVASNQKMEQLAKHDNDKVKTYPLAHILQSKNVTQILKACSVVCYLEPVHENDSKFLTARHSSIQFHKKPSVKVRISIRHTKVAYTDLRKGLG